MVEAHRFSWQVVLFCALGTFVLCVLDALWEADGFLYFVVFIPVVSLSLLGFLLNAFIRKQPGRFLSVLAMLAVFWVISAASVKNHSAVRNTARWFLWSNRYKASLLAQPDSANEDFKHIEWDGWGFPGAGDTTVYLVFDPTDSLAAAAKSHHLGKFHGIPCTVPRVSRLESQWYAVLFYTDERWGKRHLDCGMND